MLDKTHIILKAADPFDVAQLDQYGKVINTVPQIGVLYLKLYKFIDSGSALHAIQQMPGVVYAEYNQKYSVDKDNPWLYTPTTGAAVHNRAIYEVIRAPEAWDITKGHPDVVICHLDTGVQQSHPNLRVVYGGTSQEGVLNLSPANNVNRVDIDDMAGESAGLRAYTAVTLYVYEYNHLADITGVGSRSLKPIFSDPACTQPLANPYDMTGVSGLVIYMDGQADIFLSLDDGNEYYPTWSFGGIGDTSCFDAVGHGTFTCSQINGQHDTPDGVCGIAPDCTLVHFRMSDAAGGGNNMDSVNLMLAAADYPGCKVITNSWGVTDPVSPTSLALHDAINYALGKDIIVGFASGNAGTNANSSSPDYYIYPASWDGVVSVSGTGNPKAGTSITHFTAESDDYDYFTVNAKVTRNDKVFISAPMAQISGAVPDTPNIYWDTNLAGHGAPSKARRYTVLEFGGTSSAMPIVAGVIGLMYSAARERGLTRTASQIKAFLAGSATTGIKLLTGSPSTYSGAGIVNAYAAVQSAIAGSVVTAPAVQTTPKLQLTQNVTDATRQIVFKITGVTPQTLTVAIDGATTNTINSGLATGSNTVTLPVLSVGLHEMTATLTYSGGNVTVSEPVAIDPTPGVVYALPLVADGRKLRWSICGKAPSGYTIKAYKVSFAGMTVDTTVNGSTFFAVNVASGIRTGTLDLAHYPAGMQSYAAEITAYSGSTSYVFTAAADSFTNTLGYASTPPVINNFSAPATVSGLAIPVEFTATDDNAVTGYLVTETATAPALDDSRWSTTAPTTYMVSGYGNYVLFGWAKDAEGNLSGPYSVSVTTTNAVNGSALATGTESVAQVGQATATGSAVSQAVGTQATAETGTATASATQAGTATATGTEATAQTGQATATGSAVVAATGAQAISETGTATAQALAAAAAATGFQATSEYGTATARGDGAVMALLSVEINCEYGTATASASQPALTPAFYLKDAQGRMFGLRDNQGRVFAFKHP